MSHTNNFLCRRAMHFDTDNVLTRGFTGRNVEPARDQRAGFRMMRRALVAVHDAYVFDVDEFVTRRSSVQQALIEILDFCCGIENATLIYCDDEKHCE